MKKLVMMALVACAAVFAQASSVNWTFAADNAYAGYTVYLCADLVDGGFADVADIQNHLLGAGGQGTLVAGSRSASATGKAMVDADAGTMVNFFYVIVGKDVSEGYWTMAGKAEAYTTSSTHTDSSIAKNDGTALLKTQATSWAGGAGNVPEPTSGLLLLVGGAALALRRKQK